MQSWLEKLRKFFRLEHENGYANSAIIGGLAKMLDYWEGEARVDALKGLLKRIGETYPEAQQKPRGVLRLSRVQSLSK